MSVCDLIADLLSDAGERGEWGEKPRHGCNDTEAKAGRTEAKKPSHSPCIRPDSPPIRPDEIRAVVDDSPRSPLSPGTDLKTHSPASPPDTAPAHRLWFIAMPDGQRVRSSFDPPATLEQVEARHPGALKVEPGDPAAVTPGTLTAGEEAAVRAWLESIGEHDLAIIGETLERCRSSAETLAYFVGRAGEVAVVLQDAPRYQAWSITYDDGSVEVLACEPPASRAEVQRRRPVAENYQPAGDSGPGLMPAGWEPQGKADPAPLEIHDRESVQCGTCRHFKANTGAPAVAYGRCLTLPAPRRPPYSGWPTTPHHCPAHVALEVAA